MPWRYVRLWLHLEGQRCKYDRASSPCAKVVVLPCGLYEERNVRTLSLSLSLQPSVSRTIDLSIHVVSSVVHEHGDRFWNIS